MTKTIAAVDLLDKYDNDYKDTGIPYFRSKPMIEFAKLHVQAALKSANEYASMKLEDSKTSVRYLSVSSGDRTFVIDEDSILNSYSLDNIK